MGNPLERNLSMRKKAANAMERLDVLEAQADDVQKTLPNLARAVDQAVTNVSNEVHELRETLDAVVGLVGVAAVQQAIADSRLASMKAAAEGTKANIAKAVAEGNLVKAEKLGEKSLVVGRELRADGTEIPPGYAAFSMSTVKKSYREKLLGQAVGFVLETDGGGRFEVQGAYDGVEKKAPEPEHAAAPAAEVPAPAAEAPTPAPAPEAPAATEPPAPAVG